MGRRAGAIAVLIAVLLSGCTSSDQRGRDGSPAPKLDAPAIVDGQRVDLASFRGRPTLVNFWASWCDPCRRELPRLVDAQRAGTAVVGVAVKDSRRRARQMLADTGATWSSADDPDSSIARRWGVGGGLPVTFAVDASGVIRGHHLGEMQPDVVAALSAAARRFPLAPG